MYKLNAQSICLKVWMPKEEDCSDGSVSDLVTLGVTGIPRMELGHDREGNEH